MIRFLQRLLGALFRPFGPSEDMDDSRVKLSLLVQELNQQLAELKNAAARALTDEKRIRIEIREHLGTAAEWERRAVLAVESGDDELAAEALSRRSACEADALELQVQWEKQRAIALRLKGSLESARRRVSEAQRTYSSSIAQYESAKAHKSIVETLGSTDPEGPMQLVKRLDERIRELEAETQVRLELETGERSLEEEFRALERRRDGATSLESLKMWLADDDVSPPGSPERIAKLKAKLDQT